MSLVYELHFTPFGAHGDFFLRNTSLSALSYNDGNGKDSGHVRADEFESSNDWMQVGSYIDLEAAGDRSGISVSLSSDGKTVAIGALHNNGVNGIYSGHVRVYELNSSNQWSQAGNDIDGEASFDDSGFSVSLSSDGRTVAVGAPFNDGNGKDSGHVPIEPIQIESWLPSL
jgi:hypothetical protein